MSLIVIPSVSEVDAADERNRCVRIGSMDHHQLLVVRAESADALVELDLAARAVHDLGKMRILLLAELLLIRMRPPDESADVAPPVDRVDEQLSEGRPVQPLVRVPAPVQDPDGVARAHGPQLLGEPTEVRTPVQQRRDGVAGRPCEPGVASTIDRRRGIAALLTCQEPVVFGHGANRTRMAAGHTGGEGLPAAELPV
jgi:hypothetical protein